MRRSPIVVIMSRNLFLTKTGRWATIAAFCGVIASILPYAGNIWIRGAGDPTAIANREDAVQIAYTIFSALSGAGGLGALYGRHEVTAEGAKTHTPRLIPGRNKETPADWATGGTLETNRQHRNVD